MPTVNIKGVIMPENFWLEDNVACLSDFRREMAQAGNELNLYIDSPGGDVMTSNTMSTMISEWCLANPNSKCTCVIGGLCASAAANIVAKLPANFTVSCYEDSLLMYHSAYAMVMGGPDALRDNAVLMDLVNSIVIDKLLSKTTLDEKRVRTAFQEGREMWLDGKEAVACGLATDIRGGQADTTVKTATYTSNANAEAYKYAACVASTIRTKLEAHMAEETKPTVEETEAKAKAEATVEAKAEVNAEAVEPEEAKATCDEETKAEADTTEDEDTKEEEAKAEEEDEEVKALKAQNEALKAEVESLKALVAKYTPTASPTAPKAVKTDWLTMVRELNAKHLPEQEYAKHYATLKAEHKDEFDAFMRSHNTRM